MYIGLLYYRDMYASIVENILYSGLVGLRLWGAGSPLRAGRH